MSIEYNFHIRTSERHSHLIHHKLTPVMLSEKGDIWLALCIVSLSPEKTSEMLLLQTILVLTGIAIRSREDDGENSRN